MIEPRAPRKSSVTVPCTVEIAPPRPTGAPPATPSDREVNDARRSLLRLWRATSIGEGQALARGAAIVECLVTRRGGWHAPEAELRQLLRALFVAPEDEPAAQVFLRRCCGLRPARDPDKTGMAAPARGARPRAGFIAAWRRQADAHLVPFAAAQSAAHPMVAPARWAPGRLREAEVLAADFAPLEATVAALQLPVARARQAAEQRAAESAHDSLRRLERLERGLAESLADLLRVALATPARQWSRQLQWALVAPSPYEVDRVGEVFRRLAADLGLGGQQLRRLAAKDLPTLPAAASPDTYVVDLRTSAGGALPIHLARALYHTQHTPTLYLMTAGQDFADCRAHAPRATLRRAYCRPLLGPRTVHVLGRLEASAGWAPLAAEVGKLLVGLRHVQLAASVGKLLALPAADLFLTGPAGTGKRSCAELYCSLAIELGLATPSTTRIMHASEHPSGAPQAAVAGSQEGGVTVVLGDEAEGRSWRSDAPPWARRPFRRVSLPAYDEGALACALRRVLEERNLRLADDAVQKVARHLARRRQESDFASASTVVAAVEAAQAKLASRLLARSGVGRCHLETTGLNLLMADDFGVSPLGEFTARSCSAR